MHAFSSTSLAVRRPRPLWKRCGDRHRSGGCIKHLQRAREGARCCLRQINRMNGEVSLLGQKYDDALIKLHKFNNEIADTKIIVQQHRSQRKEGQPQQLRADVVFAYVTNGAERRQQSPLFEGRDQAGRDERLLPACRRQHQRDDRQPQERQGKTHRRKGHPQSRRQPRPKRCSRRCEVHSTRATSSKRTSTAALPR